MEVIPDDVAEIRDTVRDLVRRVGPGGAVFTSGGIGPTHDDVTYEGIAAAFGALHPAVKRAVTKLRACAACSFPGTFGWLVALLRPRAAWNQVLHFQNLWATHLGNSDIAM